MWQVLSEPMATRLGATLLHFVWQGAIVAAAAALLLRVLRRSAPHVRYAVAYGALVVLAAAPVVTWPLVRIPSPKTVESLAAAPATAASNEMLAGRHRSAAGSSVVDLSTSSSPGARPATVHDTPVPQISASPSPAVQAAPALQPSPIVRRSMADRFAAWLVPLQPYLLGAWLLGVALCASRLLAGIGGVWWLRANRSAVPVRLHVSLARLGRRLGLNVAARVYASSRVDEAVAVGFWRPIVLVPVSWLTELPAEMVEAIVAHELAHIRRFDLWALFGQRLVETVLFYHPAVWWLSRRISAEREMCCDAVAASAVGSRFIYVRALETVGRRSRRDTAGRSPQRSQPTYALATSFRGEDDMLLLKRVRQVLGLAAQSEAARAWPAGALVAGLALGAWTVGAGLGGSAEADAPREGDRPAAEAGREGGTRRAAEGERKEGERGAEEGTRREGAAREGAPREGTTRDGAAAQEGEGSAGEGKRRPAEGARLSEPSRRNSEAGGLEGFKPETAREKALVEMIVNLRSELAALRRQAEASRREGGAREPGTREGGRPAARDGDGAPRTGPRDGERRPAEGARDGERARTGPRDGEGAPRTGPRDGERRPEGVRDGDRRPEDARDGERRPADGERREGDKPRIDD